MWINPFISLVLFLALIFVINRIFKNKKEKSLSEIMEDTFGKIITKILLSLYVIWFFILTSMYLRYLGESLLSSIYAYAPLQFFISIILIVAFFVVKNSIENFARLTEVFLYIFLGVIILSVILATQNVDIYNFSLPNMNDLKNNITSVYIIAGILGYFTFVMFLGDKISYKETIKKHGIKTGIVATLVCLAILIITIGTFGYGLTQDLNLPYFSAIKNIKIFKSIERVESIFISLWMITEFVLITVFIYIICNILKHLTKAKDTKYISTPVIFLLYLLSLIITRNSFMLERFFSEIALTVNFVLSFSLPIFIYIVGKIRKNI